MTATMERHGMLNAGLRIGVAVSGGADSVFLLHALRDLGLAICVLHVNHRLRGAESDRDELFVRELAERFELPIYVAALPPGEGNVEQEARRARYEFFARPIAEGRCDQVATGHTLDDQAETVLARFFRGAGTAGLSGILPVTASGLIRPLLDLRREAIRECLTELGIEWKEDCSNVNKEFQRNRIRLDIMPELATTLNPALPEVLASTAEWARAEEDYWTRELDRLVPEYLRISRESVLISTGPFLGLAVAEQRRLLRRAVEMVRGSLLSIGFQHVEAIRSLMQSREGSGRIQLPGLDVYRSFDWLRLAPIGFDSRIERDFEVELPVPGRVLIAERQLYIEMELVTRSGVYNSDMIALDHAVCGSALRLRNWRPGDHYHPITKAGAEKIKTMFQESRIPLWERRTWPVIVSGDAIVWSRDFGVASAFAPGPLSERVLQIREVRESNGIGMASIESEVVGRGVFPGLPGACPGLKVS